MNVSFDDSDLAALADAVATKVAERLNSRDAIETNKRPDKLYWSETEVAKALAVSPLTVKGWRLAGHISASVNRKPIAYNWADIERIAKWMAQR